MLVKVGYLNKSRKWLIVGDEQVSKVQILTGFIWLFYLILPSKIYPVSVHDLEELGKK